MTTQSGDNLEQEFKKVAGSLMPIIAPIICLQLAHSIRQVGVEWEAEREMGRSLTKEERAYCREELEKKRLLDSVTSFFDSGTRQGEGFEVIRRIIRKQSL